MNSLITGPPLGDTAVEFLFTEFCLKSSMQNYVSNAIKKKKKQTNTTTMNIFCLFLIFNFIIWQLRVIGWL